MELNKFSTLKVGDYIRLCEDGCAEGEAIVYKKKKDVIYLYWTFYGLADKSMCMPTGCDKIHLSDGNRCITRVQVIKNDKRLVKQALFKIKLENKIYSLLRLDKNRVLCDAVHYLVDVAFDTMNRNNLK